MCELLIRVADKMNDDPFKDAKCTKRGDVIHVAPDGWPWGNEEKTLPFYRIVRLPGVPLEEAQALLGPELDDDPRNPSRVLQRRAFRLDLDHPDFKDGMNVATFRRLKLKKLKLKDPAVIG